MSPLALRGFYAALDGHKGQLLFLCLQKKAPILRLKVHAVLIDVAFRVSAIEQNYVIEQYVEPCQYKASSSGLCHAERETERIHAGCAVRNPLGLVNLPSYIHNDHAQMSETMSS